MDMAIQIPTKANSWEIAVRAEQLGFSHVWFYDTPLVNAELFAAMAAAAMKTSKIKLCTGVMVPSNSLAPTAASGLATLNALAPGRIVFGVSTGFTGRRAMGMKPMTLARMSEYIDVVQALLQCKMTEFEVEGARHKIRFLNPELGLINLEDPIPLAISAFGPKARALAAQKGAQWLASVSYPELEKAEFEEMRGLWAEAGHDPSALYAAALVGGRVLDEGETVDSAKTRAQAGPAAAIVFHNFIEQQEFGSIMGASFPFPAELEAYRKTYNQYEPSDARYLSNHRGHLMFVRPDETHLTGDVIKALTVTGTKAELVDRLRGLKEIGYHQLQFQVVPGHENEMMERWADVLAAV